jgi:hypothetical protein
MGGGGVGGVETREWSGRGRMKGGRVGGGGRSRGGGVEGGESEGNCRI